LCLFDEQRKILMTKTDAELLKEYLSEDEYSEYGSNEQREGYECFDLNYAIERLVRELHEAKEETNRLNSLINNPHWGDFFKSVKLEAAHQREKWGEGHDIKKDDKDWFWLIGYVSGKALHNVRSKQLHHIITTAAVCFNWFRITKEQS